MTDQVGSQRKSQDRRYRRPDTSTLSAGIPSSRRSLLKYKTLISDVNQNEDKSSLVFLFVHFCSLFLLFFIAAAVGSWPLFLSSWKKRRSLDTRTIEFPSGSFCWIRRLHRRVNTCESKRRQIRLHARKQTQPDSLIDRPSRLGDDETQEKCLRQPNGGTHPIWANQTAAPTLLLWWPYLTRFVPLSFRSYLWPNWSTLFVQQRNTRLLDPAL